MTIQIQATFERGVFYPSQPVSLQDGARVTLKIESTTPLLPPQALVAALADIAAMPSQAPDDGLSGADHDKILYGPGGAR